MRSQILTSLTMLKVSVSFYHLDHLETLKQSEILKLFPPPPQDLNSNSDSLFHLIADASQTFYGQKPKAMYQSLAQQSKLGYPNSQQFGVLEPEQSNSTMSDGKSRNNHAVISHTQLHNHAIVGSDEKPKLKKSATKDGSTSKLRRKILMDMPPMELTSVRRYYSLKPDMAFGWRPEDIHGAPIPMYFDYE